MKCSPPPRLERQLRAKWMLGAGAQHPFRSKLALDLFMSDRPSGSNVRASSFYCLENVEVIEHVVEGAILGKLVKYGAGSFKASLSIPLRGFRSRLSYTRDQAAHS